MVIHVPLSVLSELRADALGGGDLCFGRHEQIVASRLTIATQSTSIHPPMCERVAGEKKPATSAGPRSAFGHAAETALATGLNV